VTMGEILDRHGITGAFMPTRINPKTADGLEEIRQTFLAAAAKGLLRYPAPAPPAPVLRDKCRRIGVKRKPMGQPKPKKVRNPFKAGRCSVCGKAGHNARSCPDKRV